MRLPADAAILMVDETMLRMFPPLRALWAERGADVNVEITGQNARRVLFGAMNVRTGHRIVAVARSQKQAAFHDFLWQIRNAYRGRRLCLVLDRHGSHKSSRTVALAATLDIKLVWLPVQSPELNAMDHLWRHLKEKIAANRQYETIEQLADAAREWVLSLTNATALRLAGVKSRNYWLKRVSQNFCGPT